jgi:hypothetical protein
MGNILEQLKLMNEYLTNLDIQTTPKNILNMYNVLVLIGDLITIIEQREKEIMELEQRKEERRKQRLKEEKSNNEVGETNDSSI